MHTESGVVVVIRQGSSGRMCSRLAGCLAGLIVLGNLQACAQFQEMPWKGTGSHNSSPLSSNDAGKLFALIDEAELAYRQQHWSDASGKYQQVLTHMPEDPYLWFRLGNTLTHQGLYSQAIYAFEASLKYDSRQTKPWFNLSTTHLLSAQLASLRAWESMLPDDPGRQAVKVRLDSLTLLLQ